MKGSLLTAGAGTNALAQARRARWWHHANTRAHHQQRRLGGIVYIRNERFSSVIVRRSFRCGMNKNVHALSD